METRKRVLSDEHPNTLSSMHNLAYTLWSQTYHKEAVALIETCFQSRQQVLGKQHPDTQSSFETLNSWRADLREGQSWCKGPWLCFRSSLMVLVESGFGGGLVEQYSVSIDNVHKFRCRHCSKNLITQNGKDRYAEQIWVWSYAKGAGTTGEQKTAACTAPKIRST